MQGMSHPLQINNPLVVGAFHATLLHQFLFLLGVSVVLTLFWNIAFGVQQRHSRLAVAGTGTPATQDRETGAGEPASSGAGSGSSARVSPGAARIGAGPGAAALHPAEPNGRRFLRIAFGLLWILDGLLQVQSGMPLGMPTGVVRPAATGSPGWVHHVVNAGLTIWGNHPVAAAASVVWIQLAIGIALLVAPRGRWSRAAGAAALGWALVVWVFGEAFGAIFAPGLQWAFGAPGAALLYAVAGGLVALPEGAWRGPRLGRLLTGGLGLFFLGMALLQAWLGRGTWQGGHSGPIAAMAEAMAKTRQPHVLSAWVSGFAAFDAAHGWAVNLFLVVALAAVGAALVTGRRHVVLAGAVAAAVLCLAVWVLVQDFGFFGGLGTDPNSMVPTLLLLGGGVAASLRAPVEVREPVFLSVRQVRHAAADRRWEQLEPQVLARGAVFALAVAVGLVGAVPMAAASTNPHADPIVTEALNGTPSQVTRAAPPFSLVDQAGKPVSLASLRGKAVALTFLDPVCTSDCPVIAQTFHVADEMMRSQASKTAFVAVVANPIYRSVATVDAFDHEERLTGVHNWVFLTGSLQALTKVWNAYGVQVNTLPAGTMVAHSNAAYVIDPRGRIRAVLASDPGVTSSAHSSMSTLVSNELRAVLQR